MKRTTKKGFTLIELLAVIVILAIIALIAVPVILNIIDKANKSAFKDSAYGIISAGELYFAREQLDLNGMSSDVTIELPDSRLELKGKVPSGTITITKDGDISISVSNGRYCATKGLEDKDVTITEGQCSENPGNTGNPNNILDNSFPIEWNTLEVLNNTTVMDEQFVKVSNLVLTAAELTEAQVTVTFDGKIIVLEYIGGQNIDGAEMAVFLDNSESIQFVVGSVPRTGEYSDGTITMMVPEPGMYVINYGHEEFGSQNMDVVIENPGGSGGIVMDADDRKTNAYALILDNSADSENAVPLIFVREDEAIAVGDIYVSETYGALEVTAVYTDFENTNYVLNDEAVLVAEWVSNYNQQITSVVFEDRISPISTSTWFMLGTNIKRIDLEKLDTSNVANMSYMFFNNENLTALDVSNFITTKVTDMTHMFNNCSSLTSLDVSNFNTSNVTEMPYMFSGVGLTSLDLSSFNTSNVTNMSSMFLGCEKLTSLKISNFNTSNVTDMNAMFSGCSSLTNLNLSNFVTNNVTDMNAMFMSCSKLVSLNISNFNTSNVTDMSTMFSDVGLTSLDLSNFNTSNVTDMRHMFRDCGKLTSLNISNFNTSNVTNMSTMFRGVALTSLDLSSFNTSNVTNMSSMFNDSKNLKTIYVSELWNTTNVDEINGMGMFTGCKNLTGAVAYGLCFDADVKCANYDTGYLTYKAYD